jgi:hypothetical protein
MFVERKPKWHPLPSRYFNVLNPKPKWHPLPSRYCKVQDNADLNP